jgi:hypothetical protein
VIDEEAQRVTADDLREQHLDLRLRRGKAGLDIRLQAAHFHPPSDNKKAGERPLSDLRRQSTGPRRKL